MLGLGWFKQSAKKVMTEEEICNGLNKYHDEHKKKFRSGDFLRKGKDVYYLLRIDGNFLNVVYLDMTFNFIEETTLDIFKYDIEIISEEEAPSLLKEFANDGILKENGFVRLRKGVCPNFHHFSDDPTEWYHGCSSNCKPYIAQQPFKITNTRDNTAFIIAYNDDGDIVRCSISKDFLTSV